MLESFLKIVLPEKQTKKMSEPNIEKRPVKVQMKKHLSFAEKFLGIHFAEETPNDF